MSGLVVEAHTLALIAASQAILIAMEGLIVKGKMETPVHFFPELKGLINVTLMLQAVAIAQSRDEVAGMSVYIFLENNILKLVPRLITQPQIRY